MSLTWTPSPMPLEESAKSIEFVASTYGVKFINGGEFYGADDLNLKLIKEFLAITKIPANELVISIKGGAGENLKISGDKATVSRSIENIISYFPPVGDAKRPKIIYEQARVDLDVPQAETIGYIHEFVKSGKIDGISLSETSAATIATSAEAAPISAVEVEFSLMSLDIVHNGVLAEASRRNIPIIAYSPLGRGLLTDYAVENALTFLGDLKDGDFRKYFDRFAPENFENNLKLIKALYKYAHEKKGISLEALALSWITSVSGSDSIFGKVGQVIPIPSGSTPTKIDANFGHLVKLSDSELKEIQEIIDGNKVLGGRYNDQMEKDLAL